MMQSDFCLLSLLTFAGMTLAMCRYLGHPPNPSEILLFPVGLAEIPRFARNDNNPGELRIARISKEEGANAIPLDRQGGGLRKELIDGRE